MKMRDLLSIERVIPRLRVRDKRDAVRKLASKTAGHAGLPEETILRSVLDGVELPAFGPGAGVSLPHALVPGLPRPIASFARLEPAIDFGAADGSSTDLVMLLLSPAERMGDHLRALACIARALRKPDTRTLLRASKCRDFSYVILCGNEDEPPVVMRAGGMGKRHSGAASLSAQ